MYSYEDGRIVYRKKLGSFGGEVSLSDLQPDDEIVVSNWLTKPRRTVFLKAAKFDQTHVDNMLRAWDRYDFGFDRAAFDAALSEEIAAAIEGVERNRAALVLWYKTRSISGFLNRDETRCDTDTPEKLEKAIGWAQYCALTPIPRNPTGQERVAMRYIEKHMDVYGA